MLMCQFGQSVNIGNIAVRISKGFNIDCPGILPDSGLNLIKIMYIDKTRRNAEGRKRMSQLPP